MYEGMTIEQMIGVLFEYKKEMQQLSNQKSEIQAKYDELEYKLVQSMQEEGLTKGGCDAGTVSVKVEMYPKIDDMDAFVEWCYNNDKANMLQKRVSKAVFDETFAITNEYPDGISTYDKTTLSLRRK